MATTIAEYSDPRVSANRSVRSVLASAPSRNPSGIYGPVRLVHKSAGWECAGSMARLTSEAWGAVFDYTNGSSGGQWFLTEAEARARFALWAVVD